MAAPSALAAFSNELSALVERVGPSVVRVDDNSRLTATGVIWSDDGLVLTTSHGVERDEELAIVLGDDSRHAATLVGRDHDSDLALLRVDGASGLPAIDRAPDAAAARGVGVGSLVLALGRPGTAGLHATIGIVSARQETQTAGAPEYILQTDADVYPGFSGGPLVSAATGAMIGITNRMFGRGTSVALGVPLAERVALALQTHGRVRRGYLGVRTQLVTLPEAMRANLALSQERGLLVVAVENNSPAERGNLMLGDTILAVNGQSIEDTEDLRKNLGPADSQSSLRLLRGGALHELTLVVGVGEG